MRIGLSTIIGSSTSLKEMIKYSIELGLNSFEVKLDKVDLVSRLARSGWSWLTNVVSSYDDVYFTLHAPYIDLNLASLNPLIAKASVKAIERTIRMASALGIEIVTIHPGRLSRDYPKSALPKALENLTERLSYLSALSSDLGVKISLENDHRSSDRVLAGYPDQVEKILSETDCYLTLDVGHANTLVSPLSFVEALREKIIEVHLNDNMGERDEHLAIGDGNIDFKSFFKNLFMKRFEGPFIIEVYDFSGIHKSINYLRESLNLLRSK